MKTILPTEEDVEFFEKKLARDIEKGRDSTRSEKQLRLIKEAYELSKPIDIP